MGLVASLAVNQDPVDVGGADGLDLPGVEMPLELDENSETLR